MKLTQAHIAALQADQHDLFVEDMARFFQHKDAFHADALGADGLRTAIAVGVRWARQDGITERDPVRAYLQLMFFLGGRFTQDPLMPWARDILDPTRAIRTQAERMEQLRTAALGYLRDTCGPDGAPLRAFMKACTALRDGDGADMSDADLAAFVKSNYRLKAEYLGDPAIAKIIQSSAAYCANADMTARRSVTYLTLMRVVYGYWMADDPLFPWVRQALQDPRKTADRDAVFERLVGTFLDRVEAHIADREQKDVG